MEIVYQYGLFLAETITIVIAIAIVIALVFNAKQRKNANHGDLQIKNLSEQFKQVRETMALFPLDELSRKDWQKAQKKKEKAAEKLKKQQIKEGTLSNNEPTLFILSFKGSLDAHEVEGLREEINAILAVATSHDEVLLKLESPGGVVHGYGLAASQLMRLRSKGIKLTVTVDKVAASGGYMMACVADKIIAAPFAILGSIGVVAQIPNIHRLLEKNDIDIELHTAGEFKRTLTLMGKNTEAGREKFQQELDETHQLFKQFVQQNRPSLDINRVATGEHWFGTQAIEKGLVDEIATSDDILLTKLANFKLISVTYVARKKRLARFLNHGSEAIDKILLRWLQRGQRPLL